MDDVSKRVVELVGLQLGRRRVRPEDRLLADLEAESIDLVHVVAGVEDAFSIEIEEDEVVDIVRVEDLVRLVRERLGGPSSGAP